MKKEIKIFLSSPSDVKPERDLAKNVIKKLQDQFREQVKLTCIAWEDQWYTADKGFQEQINKYGRPSDSDIVLCILWKRLGSDLPEEFNREDGSPRTETEWEYEEALSGAEKRDTTNQPRKKVESKLFLTSLVANRTLRIG